MVSALGVIEIFAWGSSFYLIAVLAAPIAAETGWSGATIAAGVSLALLVNGLLATTVGRLIEARGGRQVLAAGMALLACGLALLGGAQGLAGYFVAWAVIGAGMSCSLYDAAFSTLGRIFGRDARSPITVLTLWGGFASTVCWPITAFLVEMLGWRWACFAYAGLHLAVTLPLALVFLPRESRSEEAGAVPAAVPPPPIPVSDLRFLCLAAAGVTLSMISTIWSVHFVSILAASGYATAAAIAVGTLIGPAQVGARLLELMGRGRHHPVWTMIVSTAAVLAGFAGLMLGLPAAAAMIAYGAGNGLWSIARGALPLAMFGPAGYARTMGRLARPMLFASAAAPWVGGWALETLGPQALSKIIALAAAFPVVMALVLWRRAGGSYAE